MGAVVSGHAQAATPEVLDAEDLGVSLARIQRRLDRLPEGDDARRLLRLNFYVEVYGRAPRLDLFEGFDLHNGPVPYGVPRHNEMLSAMRSDDPLYPPAINLNPIAGWAWKALQP